VLAVPFSRLAADLGRPVVKNVVALGALQAASDLLPASAMLETLRHVLKDKAALMPLNEAAFAAGQQAVAPAVA
jgi:2-oxoisovalerate ferredoxin oxidoreductase beta subunit